jgi:hypothetical protein
MRTGGDGAARPVPTAGLNSLLELQRTAGNRAVAQLVAAYHGGGTAVQVSLHGTTTPDFDGGNSKVLSARVVRAKGCDCVGDEPCYEGSATLQVTYSVKVTIEMPDVPEGLSTCQERRAREFLRNVLGPHEQEHARRLRTYNGTTTRPFAVKACGRDAVHQAAQAKAQEMHETEAEQRAQKADALSQAIDPFQRKIDLDC